MFKGTISPLFGRVRSILNCINYTVSLLGHRKDILTELTLFVEKYVVGKVKDFVSLCDTVKYRNMHYSKF